MEICDKFLCVNRKNKECHVPKNVVAFTCKHTNAPCPKARCEYCSVKCGKNCDWRIDRMSISERVKELRGLATETRCLYDDDLHDALIYAADTIESLSAKLADMERSAEDCGGGWIYCGDGENLPEESGYYLVTYHEWSNGEFLPKFDDTYVKRLHYQKSEQFIGWNFSKCVDKRAEDDMNREVLAWQPLPEPYHEP